MTISSINLLKFTDTVAVVPLGHSDPLVCTETLI